MFLQLQGKLVIEPFISLNLFMELFVLQLLGKVVVEPFIHQINSWNRLFVRIRALIHYFSVNVFAGLSLHWVGGSDTTTLAGSSEQPIWKAHPLSHQSKEMTFYLRWLWCPLILRKWGNFAEWKTPACMQFFLQQYLFILLQMCTRFMSEGVCKQYLQQCKRGSITHVSLNSIKGDLKKALILHSQHSILNEVDGM